jgi:hypothetical protein
VTSDDDLAAHARTLIDANRYLTLGTTAADGRPWTTPVYFTAAGVRDFYWSSATDAVHSRHLAERPRVSWVVFDSTVGPYHGRALSGVGEARELSGADLDRGLAAFPRGDGDGAAAVDREDVTGPSGYRLYRATASDLWVLCPREPRQPCALHGRAEDHRTRVPVG